jgi:nitrogen regulatory protein PII
MSARHRAADDLVDFVPQVRVEIVCHDEVVERIVAVIQQKAHTGLRGDGKIYISDVEDAIRIETGERGEQAV